jgi:RimJ/RimL family protein N-acetyltransferase
VRGPFQDPKHSHDRAPTLETERLVLRHVRASDVDYYAAVHADEEVTRHVGGILTREDSWRRAMTGAGFWGVLGIGVWVAERRADGEPIGHIGFFDFQRELDPSIAGEPEMGWIFRRDAQGQGYALEAGRALLDWFDLTFSGLSIPAIIGLENIASIRLAERLGFERLDDVVYRDEVNAFFRRPPKA